MMVLHNNAEYLDRFFKVKDCGEDTGIHTLFDIIPTMTYNDNETVHEHIRKVKNISCTFL